MRFCAEKDRKKPVRRGESMKSFVKSRLLLTAGIVGCLLYVTGDFLFAATGRGQTTETLGLFTKAAWLEMAEWRMWASILCGFVGTLLYYMGFHRMEELLRLRIGETIDEVSKRCGYTSLSDFRRVFKRYTGISPLKWLKREFA